MNETRRNQLEFEKEVEFFGPDFNLIDSWMIDFGDKLRETWRMGCAYAENKHIRDKVK